MMRTHLFSTLSLLAVLLTACASSNTSEPSASQPTASAVVVQPSETLVLDVPSPTAETTLPVATSRGPNLEATDPLMVSLASGQLQFVEFFRFT